MLNTATLSNWMLVDWEEAFRRRFCGEKISTDEFFEHFVLPTAARVQLFGNTSKDSRSSVDTGEFAEGHRIHTGDLLFFSPTECRTERTIYTLTNIHPKYKEWLDGLGVSYNTSVTYETE